jgi:hypothetical protein
MTTVQIIIAKDVFLGDKVLSQDVISIEIKPTMTVSDFKTLIMRKTQLSIERQIIHLGKQRLCNKNQLCTYDLKGKNQLVLTALPMDPKDIAGKIDMAVQDLELVTPSCSITYPVGIFLTLADIDKFSAYCVACGDIPKTAMELDCSECVSTICEECLQYAAKRFDKMQGHLTECLNDGCGKLIDLSKTTRNRSITRLISQQMVKCISDSTYNDKKCE